MHEEPGITAETIRFAARDGRLLAGTLYTPRASNGRSVLISSATGVPRGYYDRYARFLAGDGFTALTYDYRGIGESRSGPLRADRARLREWGEADLAAAIDHLAARAPAHRLVAVGHSIGGQVFGLADNNRQVAALMTICCASGYWRLWPWYRQLVLGTQWCCLMPAVSRALSYYPARRLGLGGEDLPGGVAHDWARWCRHPDYVIDETGQPLRAHFHGYRGRILSYAVSDDWMAPPAAVRAMHDCYAGAEIEFREIAPHPGQRPIGHSGYFRDDNRALWPSGAAWLRAQ
ncbi:alpha/beta hydrolase family protein [Burkholderia alba]|uniref:alpha/beta hydrolase family protein n=1 Tax=Burkholderia alba TaxID=2683677 RepID=UPI002B05F93B|nr:alpha/beta fold hydrolase [Burkholderia alba]